eukprot:2436051-Rhodomonas_salina.1
MSSWEPSLDSDPLTSSECTVFGICGWVKEYERDLGIKFAGLPTDVIYRNIFRHCEDIKCRRLAKTLSDCYSNLVYSALEGRLEKGD